MTAKEKGRLIIGGKLRDHRRLFEVYKNKGCGFHEPIYDNIEKCQLKQTIVPTKQSGVCNVLSALPQVW